MTSMLIGLAWYFAASLALYVACCASAYLNGE